MSDAQWKGKLKMANTTKSIHGRSAESTRPDLTPKQEAEICGLDLGYILMLRQRLNEAWPGPQYESALDKYVKATSVTLNEAAIMLGRPPVRLSCLAKQGSIRAFIHRNRWRIWMSHLRKMEKDMPG